MVRFKKGTVIACPKCGNKIATANRNIHNIETITSKAWDGIESCDPTYSKCCKRSYLRRVGFRTELYTSEGWK